MTSASDTDEVMPQEAVNNGAEDEEKARSLSEKTADEPEKMASSSADLERGEQASTSASATPPEKEDKPTGQTIVLMPLTDLSRGVVGWDSIEDPKDPKNWAPGRKWRTMILVAMSTLLLPLGSTLFAPGVGLVATEFHETDTTILTFMVSIFVLGFGWGPILFHAPLSELYGRKVVISLSNLMYACFNIGCAWATSTNMFLAMRFLGGLLGCASMVVGGGVISDMFSRDQMGRASSMYALGPLLGPVIGPVIGGWIAQDLGWRWAFRFLLILSGTMFFVFSLLAEETHAPTLLRRKTRQVKKELGREDLICATDEFNHRTPSQVFIMGITRPFALLTTNPVSMFLGFYMAIAFAFLYIFLTTISGVFKERYGFSTGTTGLAYLGLGVGLMSTLGVIGSTNDKLVAYLTKKNGGVREPEFRLRPLFVSCLILPIAMFWYGWAVQGHAHWFAVVASMFPMGVGMVSTMFPIQTYLIEVYAPYGLSASANAAGNCFRMTAGAFFPLVAPSMFARLGYGWGCSLLAFLALFFCGSMAVTFVWYGKVLRVKYPPKI
ncbi:major facilitator superfamily domain-containing protein [Myxozyma melibiosi]|uniref:Major facilitator superfamily domain-containing protein n=1 Tax=Myxozyma melibiosi TaxID=54550 RepID=A0ABR1F6K9_9ASCO